MASTEPYMEPCVIPTWRYRIEPQASSGGVLITIPSSRTGVTQILIFMAIWCGAGGFMTSMAMSIAPEAGIGPIVVTLLGATSMTVGVLFRLFASESIAITPTVFTHQWGMLGLNRTKHYSIQHMGPLFLSSTMDAARRGGASPRTAIRGVPIRGNAGSNGVLAFATGSDSVLQRSGAPCPRAVEADRPTPAVLSYGSTCSSSVRHAKCCDRHIQSTNVQRPASGPKRLLTLRKRG
ncbi:hypothetical protein H257_15915 [Aphanomyces astaci]|uniref:Uncharacterized protein n=1 Tax=Aphanomyces astaci TaxID=112090 RepID=W4FKC3_APHAT|nr:hypothetical protein H257_15915 [Aphanomyces astaci]ETV67930.1 hypothetical protein H257_15915 [Aphanomyces astaci]|eukprot:XP_009842493.1 hypothetical protein H257_15915 [Aphanomyces astaci]